MGLNQQFFLQRHVKFPILSNFKLDLENFLKDDRNKKIYSKLEELNKGQINISHIGSLTEILSEIKQNNLLMTNQEPESKAYIINVADYCASKAVDIIDKNLTEIVEVLINTLDYNLGNVHTLYLMTYILENVRGYGYKGHMLETLAEDVIDLFGGQINMSLEFLLEEITDTRALNLTKMNLISNYFSLFHEVSKKQERYSVVNSGIIVAFFTLISEDLSYYYDAIKDNARINLTEADFRFQTHYDYLRKFMNFDNNEISVQLVKLGQTLIDNAFAQLELGKLQIEQLTYVIVLNSWLNKTLKLYDFSMARGFYNVAEDSKRQANLFYDKLIVNSMYPDSLISAKSIIDAKQELRMPYGITSNSN